jgi:hypothetical protein
MSANANDEAAPGRSLGGEVETVTRLAAQSGAADFAPN